MMDLPFAASRADNEEAVTICSEDVKILPSCICARDTTGFGSANRPTQRQQVETPDVRDS